MKFVGVPIHVNSVWVTRKRNLSLKFVFLFLLGFFKFDLDFLKTET